VGTSRHAVSETRLWSWRNGGLVYETCLSFIDLFLDFPPFPSQSVLCAHTYLRRYRYPRGQECYLAAWRYACAAAPVIALLRPSLATDVRLRSHSEICDTTENVAS